MQRSIIDQNRQVTIRKKRQQLASADPAVRNAAFNQLQELTLAFKAKGVDIAKLATATSAMLVGFNADDMSTAVTASTNAAENNAFWLVAIALYKAVDFASTVYDAYELYSELSNPKTTAERKQEIAEELLTDFSLQVVSGKAAKFIFKKIQKYFGETQEAVLAKLDNLANGRLETAGGPSFDGHGPRVEADPNLYSRNHSNTAPSTTSSSNYVPPKANNMNEFFDMEFGSALNNASQKTAKKFQGQSVYKINQRLGEFAKGDQFYLDNLHKDHIEVFDKRGKFKGVYNLDGNKNLDKTEKALKDGRKLPKN